MNRLAALEKVLALIAGKSAVWINLLKTGASYVPGVGTEIATLITEAQALLAEGPTVIADVQTGLTQLQEIVGQITPPPVIAPAAATAETGTAAS